MSEEIQASAVAALNDPSRVAKELTGPIITASSVEDQIYQLQLLPSRVRGKESIVVNEQVAALLLQEVVLLGESVEGFFIEILLKACGYQHVLPATINFLKDKSSIQKASLSTTLKMLEQILFETTWWTETCSKDESIAPWIQLLLFIPQHVANACRYINVSLPSWAIPSRYVSNLVSATASKIKTQEDDCTLMFLTNLIRRLLQRNQGAYVCMGLWDGPADSMSDLFLHLSQNLTPKDLASLCHSMFQFIVRKPKDDSTTREFWVNSAIPRLLSTQSAQTNLVQLAVLQQKSVMTEERLDRLLVEMMVDILVQATLGLYDSDEEEYDPVMTGSKDKPEHANSAFYRLHLEPVASVWSQASFIRQVDVAMQVHVTSFLMFGLSNELAGPVDPMSVLVENIVQGVSARLSSSVQTVRLGAMQIAECLARSLGQDLHFDELQEHNLPATLDNIIEVQNPQSLQLEKADDPTAESGDKWSSLAENDDLDIGNDLPEYDLDDDEVDLRTSPPLYLSECLDLLRTPTTDEGAPRNHETALRHLPSLIQARPADLSDIGHHVAQQLLNMENSFGIKLYDDMRLESLVALTVQEPLSVGQSLIDIMFEDLPLMTRVVVLNAINRASFELSGRRTDRAIESNSYQHITAVTRLSGKRSLVPMAPIDSEENGARQKTRRWGKGQARQGSASVSNHFVRVGPVWFYALVGNFMKRKDDTSLWAGETGSRLLSSLFVSLAIIVECAGKSPGSAILAKDLFEVIWGFRNAEIADVRLSVLYGITATITSLGKDADLLLNQTGVCVYLLETAAHDPDGGCRDLAQDLSNSMYPAFQMAALTAP